jgi:hypothetical protein
MDIEIDYFKFYNIFINRMYPENKNILLEPLSSIFRILLLKYKPDGTKISICNNSIKYNSPGYSQGLMRNINGDAREDLHNLYNPFIKCMEWFPIEENCDEMYKYYYRESIKGLKFLVDSYEKGTIINHTLNHYIKMIEDCLENKQIDKLDIEESPLLEKMKDFWRKEEIDIIYQLFLLADKVSEDEKLVYIKIIDDIIVMKENKLNEYILKSSTSYN